MVIPGRHSNTGLITSTGSDNYVLNYITHHW